MFQPKTVVETCESCEKNFSKKTQLSYHKFSTHNIFMNIMDLEESKMLIEELMKMNNNLEENNIALEMEVKASHKIIQKLKRDKSLLKEYEEAIIDKDDLIRKFEKGRVIMDNVIISLKDSLKLKEKEICNVEKVAEGKIQIETEKKALEKQILEICKENNLEDQDFEGIRNAIK